MNYVMTDKATGLQYKLAPGPQDLVEGIIPYVPELHAHLWTYVPLHSITYTTSPIWKTGMKTFVSGMKM